MDTIGLYVSVIGLALGALLGLKGLLDPQWAARLVRLQTEPGKPEGAAEFRATFGGMFFGLHAVALLLVHVPGGGQGGLAACWVVAAGWWFTALGRAWSRLVDPPARHPFVLQSIAIEIAAGFLIAAWPIAVLLG
jgi:hypothetical protein